MTAPNRGRLQGWSLARSSVSRGVPSAATLLPGGAAPALTAPTNLVAPSISGSPIQGATLTASSGSWSGNPVPNLTYLWKRDGVSTGQTGTSYNLTLADVDTTITVTVTGTNSQGSASVTSAGVGPITASQAPSFSVDPSISGSPVVGETLTGDDGTYSGSPTPTIIARRWYSDGLAVGTGPTYVVDLSDVGNMITFEVVVENSEGQTSDLSAAVGPVTTPPPEGSLDAPVLTKTSAPGAAPFTWDTALNMDQVAPGNFLILEQAAGLTPATNPDGTWVTPVQTISHFLTEMEVADAQANGGVGNIDWSADGFVTWTGAGAIHVYITRDDGVSSPVSNSIADTIVAATTTWTTGGVSGTSAVSPDKAASIVVTTGSPRTATGLNGRGVREFVRATAASAHAKNYTEFTVNNLGGGFYLGKDDGTEDYSAGWNFAPGNSDAKGWSFSFWNTGARVEFATNNFTGDSTTNLGTFTTTLVNGDKIGVNHDTTTNKVQLFHIPASTGVPYQIGPDRTASSVGTRWFFGSNNAEGVTVNFGQDAFARSLDTGYEAHG